MIRHQLAFAESDVHIRFDNVVETVHPAEAVRDRADLYSAKLGIHFAGEEDYNRQILIHQGVPEAAIHILPQPVVNTEEELQEVGREMRENGKKTIILVTSPQHTRRVWTLWQRLVGKDPKAIVHGAQDDPFDADHWWRNTRDVMSVVHEILGLVNAWLGLPVPPHSG
jgi:uncharacterized SAM-binding protein YcdF (DUF218 family)